MNYGNCSWISPCSESDQQLIECCARPRYCHTGIENPLHVFAECAATSCSTLRLRHLRHLQLHLSDLQLSTLEDLARLHKNHIVPVSASSLVGRLGSAAYSPLRAFNTFSSILTSLGNCRSRSPHQRSQPGESWPAVSRICIAFFCTLTQLTGTASTH